MKITTCDSITEEVPALVEWNDMRTSVPAYGSKVEYFCRYLFEFVWSATISDTGEIIYDDLFGSEQEDVLMRTGFIAWRYAKD